MFGVYVHVPFCPYVCPYCDFNVLVRRAPPWEAFVAALRRELEARASIFAGQALESLYFGGGTPSLAPPWWIASVKQAVEERFGPVPGEITLEANPGTLDAEKLAGYRAAGVNRVSLGWQSTNDRLLQTLGRGHSAEESRAAAALVRAAGVPELSVDLIFAVPGQSLADLEHDLDELERLAPEHVSLYGLTYHERTRFQRWRDTGRLVPVDEELEVRMMARIDERLRAAGYEHYEVSNFARPGHRAVHNSSYWTGAPYLGLGPGAHSFAREGWERGWRWEGTRRAERYIAAWEHARPAGLPRADDGTVTWIEELSARQLLAERMLCGLRTSDGVKLAEPPMREARAELERGIAEACRRGWAELVGDRLAPTALGFTYADDLAGLFF